MIKKGINPNFSTCAGPLKLTAKNKKELMSMIEKKSPSFRTKMKTYGYVTNDDFFFVCNENYSYEITSENLEKTSSEIELSKTLMSATESFYREGLSDPDFVLRYEIMNSNIYLLYDLNRYRGRQDELIKKIEKRYRR